LFPLMGEKARSSNKMPGWPPVATKASTSMLRRPFWRLFCNLDVMVELDFFKETRNDQNEKVV
jgi:hypothetical protein